MLSWLAQTAQDHREAKNLSIEDVASAGGLKYHKLYRFESKADRWPRDIDQLVAAYAEATGIGDGRLLWAEAISRWQEHGAPPLARPDETPDLLAEATEIPDALAQQDERTSQPPEEDSTEQPNEDRKRRRAS